jgi:hypothetical protein
MCQSSSRYIRSGLFGLKVVFHNHIPDDKRPMARQFMRRAQMGLREYAIACQELSEFVAQGSHSAWDEYFSTLYHFEASRKPIRRTSTHGRH